MVISVLAIILPMAGGTVFFLLRAQSQSAEGLRDAMAITQLSHTFRSDVHAARAARMPADADGCELELDDSRTIVYRAEPNGFVSRIVRRGEVVERREQFRIGAARRNSHSPNRTRGRRDDCTEDAKLGPCRSRNDITCWNSHRGDCREKFECRRTCSKGNARAKQAIEVVVAAEGAEDAMRPSLPTHGRGRCTSEKVFQTRRLANSTRNRRADRAGLSFARYGHRHVVASGGSRRTALSEPSRTTIAGRMGG